MAFTFAVITDEVSPHLAEGLAFARREGLDTVDIRSIEGVNFLSLSASEQERVAGEVRKAGLTVGCLATPILKWPKPGQESSNAGDQFGFDARGRSTSEIYDDAFAAAHRLGTRNLRIFSFLTYAGFVAADLDGELDQLLARAERHDMVLHIENEPVCNIASVAALAGAISRRSHPRLRALLDIGNAAASGDVPSLADLRAVMPFVDMMHFKDYRRKPKAFVALGEGEVPYAELLPACLAAAQGRNLTLTIETHVPGEPEGATRRSLAALRRLVSAPASSR